MSSLIVPPRIIIFIFLLFAQHSLQAEGVAVLVLIFLLRFDNDYNTDNNAVRLMIMMLTDDDDDDKSVLDN